MPILREFALDAPYFENKVAINKLATENNCDYSQTTQNEYNLNWKWKRREFSNQTRNITSLFERKFETLKTENCWKVLVECVPCITSRPKNLLGVYVVQVVYDIEEFFNLNDDEKKKTALELLYKGILEIQSLEQWDASAFCNAYMSVIEARYINNWIWKQKKTSPDRKHTAKVLCEHGIYACDISIIVEDKNGNEIKSDKIVNTKPDEWAFSKYFGQLVWKSKNEVILYSKDKNSYFNINIE